nr:NAD(P)H-dependent oxidoreductase [Neisseria meningitidis]
MTMQVFLTIPGYDVEAEIEKFVWMDAVIWQMPGWWMHEPWTVKKYIDGVLTAGHGKLYQSDGRHSVNPTEGYGTGGLLQGKKRLPTFLCNDVVKNPQVEKYLADYQAHLEKVFG